MEITSGHHRSVLASLAVVLPLMSVPAGCDQELGPAPMETTPVQGQVTLAGRPVGGGWIEFLPTGGTVGRLRSAPLDDEGRFQADDVAVGTVAVRLVGFPELTPPDAATARFLAQIRQVYLIEREITSDPAPTLSIDLADEVARLRGGR